jgi:hypothetical protein
MKDTLEGNFRWEISPTKIKHVWDNIYFVFGLRFMSGIFRSDKLSKESKTPA